MFDETLYLIEMSGLLADAADRLRAEHPAATVYSVSIWTDPDAAISTVSFDTAEHSATQVAALRAWAAGHQARLLARGEAEQARLLEPPAGMRNVNPADFAFRDVAEVEHRSFPQGWAHETEGRCWRELGPALDRVRERALALYAGLPLHADAELAVHSDRDWYDGPVKFRRAAI